MGFNKSDNALSSVSKNSENPNPDLTDAATVKVFLMKKCKIRIEECVTVFRR